MARLVEKRNAASFQRELDSLRRLKVAIKIDETLDKSRALQALSDIERLQASLTRLVDTLKAA